MVRKTTVAASAALVPSLGAQLAAWKREENVAVLRAEWLRLYRTAPPDRLSRDLLIRGISYRLQESALGGLRPAAKRKLATWIESHEDGPRPKAIPQQTQRLKPGAVLVRTWHGVTHTVLVAEEGFEHQGQRYESLSTIAERITGAHWSGPRFFGLVRRRKMAEAAGA